MNTGKWSREEIELLEEFSKQGYTPLEISLELERPLNSVKNLRNKLGYSSKNTYKDLYKGNIDEVKNRLIKIMQDSPIVTYEYFNRASTPTPSATKYREIFGSWSAALEAAGIKRNNCVMKSDWPTTLYLVEFKDGYYKIGITQQTTKIRLAKNKYPEYEIILELDLSLEEARRTERAWLNVVKPFQFIPENFPAEGRGSTECFKLP